MPLYTYETEAGDQQDYFLRWSDLPKFEMENPGLKRVITAAKIVSDINPYACPITGRMITSRSEHRDNLARHGMRVMEPDESPTKGKIRNAAFAKKRGLKVSDEFKDYDSSVAKKSKEAAHG